MLLHAFTNTKQSIPIIDFAKSNVKQRTEEQKRDDLIQRASDEYGKLKTSFSSLTWSGQMWQDWVAAAIGVIAILAEASRASKHFTQRQKARLEEISIGYNEFATARTKSYMEEKVALVEQLKDKSKNANGVGQASNKKDIEQVLSAVQMAIDQCSALL